MEDEYNKICSTDDFKIYNKDKSCCYNIMESVNDDTSSYIISSSIKGETSENIGISCLSGGISTGYCDYAELFETIDGNLIDVGYFVTFEGEKVRKATASDSYILGVTSATPGVLGNSNDFHWKNKYMKDEWGRIKYHEVRTPLVVNKRGRLITLESIERRPILNPNWDSTMVYIPRLSRPEWVSVGLLGKILVRDNGTCQANGYCKPNDEGIALPSSEGYRVIKRTGPNQILILFR